MISHRARLVIHSIGLLATPPAGVAPRRARELGELVEHERAAIAIDDAGCVIAAGAEADVRAAATTDEDTELHDAGGALAIPGLVDCHAHPLFAGDRAAEFELRNLGSSYEQIHAAGGGIRSTVASTREAIVSATLHESVRRHFDWMLAAGTTTAEAKGGYALTFDGELAMHRVASEVAASHPLNVSGTVLAAHVVPAEHDGRADDYIDEVAIPVARAAASAQLASAADIFLERGAFDASQARRYLLAARDAGLLTRLHGDQFSDQGAIELACELGARSIDHLEALDPDGHRLRMLAASHVAAVLLPLSSLFLSRPFAPGRALVDAGAIVALASDFNPGSSYGESLALAMTLACTGCGLTAREAITACTANSAWVLGLEHGRGRIAPGLCADVVLVDQPSPVHLAYHAGNPAIDAVFVEGRRVS